MARVSTLWASLLSMLLGLGCHHLGKRGLMGHSGGTRWSGWVGVEPPLGGGSGREPLLGGRNGREPPWVEGVGESPRWVGGEGGSPRWVGGVGQSLPGWRERERAPAGWSWTSQLLACRAWH